MGCWEQNLVPLQGQYVLITREPPLQPHSEGFPRRGPGLAWFCNLGLECLSKVMCLIFHCQPVALLGSGRTLKELDLMEASSSSDTSPFLFSSLILISLEVHAGNFISPHLPCYDTWTYPRSPSTDPNNHELKL